MSRRLFPFVVGLASLSLAPSLAPSLAMAVAPLVAEAPTEVPGTAGGFDYMRVDPAAGRLLAAHKGAGTLTLVDLKTGKLLAPVKTGAAQGVDVDERDHLYVVGDDDEKKVVFVDAKSLAVVGEVKVAGPVDALAFDPKNGLVYADHDDGHDLWVIDAKTRKLVTTVELPGVPEFVEYDPVTDRVYQNIKDKDVVVVINPATNKVEATWSTLPVTKPHGLAIDRKTGRLFAAGHNGKLVALDLKTGAVVGTATIAEHADQIVFDPERRIVYSACKGFVSAVKETDKGLESLGNVPSPKGAHTLTVDPASHDVWVSYSDKQHAYLQRFKATP